jgi:hypothetical protein
LDPTDEEAATGAFRSPWQDASRAAARHDIPDASTADSDEMHIRSVSPEPLDSPVRVSSIPIWLREAAPSFRWSWVPVPIRHAARRTTAWTAGPKPPQIQCIQPWFPSIQELPLRLVDRWLPKRRHRVVALVVLYAAWAMTFSLVIFQSARSGDIAGYGKPMDLWCGAGLWNGAKACGLAGNNCRPFTNASLAFRCNANCASVQLLSPYMIGGQEAIYTPLVIGGGNEDGDPLYRADSFICQAAVHAGVVSNAVGGCGILHLTGSATDYVASESNGIASYGFDSYFPKSYILEPTSMEECGTVDMRWPLLGVTLTFTIIISLFTTSPAVFFWSLLVMIFIHVGLVSDKPNISSYGDLISLLLGRFLPAAFTAYVLYRAAARPQLAGLTAQVEKTILYHGGVWIGALNNYTFSFIPLQRLTPHDLKQPGAMLSLICICMLLFAIACGQVYYLRQEGLLRKYLAIYSLMALGLIIGVVVPPLSLRVHHYILALLLIPGTRPQTRPGLLYQGILLGLFINGTARWGFASILQTATALRGGGPDGPEMTSPVPLVNVTVEWAGKMAKGISFAWSATQLPEGTDGVSIVVNDVERHRWYVGEGGPGWEYRREKGRGRWWGGGEDVREYFRFGYLAGSDALEYSAAGVWEGNGTWRGFIGEGDKGENGDGEGDGDGGEL